MPDRLLIVDTDVFILLAAAGRLDRVAELLDVSVENIRRLDALPYQLEKGKRFKKTYPDEVRAEAHAKSMTVLPVEGRPADHLFQRLVDTPDIDEGEALLFGLVAEQEHFYLASGDKRAMVALGSAGDLGDVRAAVAGRVVCFEAALKLLVEHDGVADTAAAFAAVREANQTLRVVFSEAAATNQAQCLHYIASYFNDLTTKVGVGLLYTS